MAIIWITGGKGFLGRYLAQSIGKLSTNVFGIGHGSWPQEDYRSWSYNTWLNAEIDFSSLNHLASISGLPDVIYHLAGGSAVGPSIQNPYEDFQRTVDTTARLLEWVRQISPNTKVIGVSSAAIYGGGFDVPINENFNGTPYSPYGFHKAMLESLFKSYKDTFGLNVAVVRLFSIYGPNLEKQLLWDICNKLTKSSDGTIVLGGSGDEIRDWLYISDAVDLLKMVADDQHFDYECINGGTGIGTNVKLVAQGVIEAWGSDFRVLFSGVARPGDPQSLVADITLANKLGFFPKMNLYAGLHEVVKWFKERQA